MTYLKHIKPNSYFGQLIKSKPSLNPHNSEFLHSILRDFERHFLEDSALVKTVFQHILDHI